MCVCAYFCVSWDKDSITESLSAANRSLSVRLLCGRLCQLWTLLSSFLVFGSSSSYRTNTHTWINNAQLEQTSGNQWTKLSTDCQVTRKTVQFTRGPSAALFKSNNNTRNTLYKGKATTPMIFKVNRSFIDHAVAHQEIKLQYFIDTEQIPSFEYVYFKAVLHWRVYFTMLIGTTMMRSGP